MQQAQLQQNQFCKWWRRYQFCKWRRRCLARRLVGRLLGWFACVGKLVCWSVFGMLACVGVLQRQWQGQGLPWPAGCRRQLQQRCGQKHRPVGELCCWLASCICCSVHLSVGCKGRLRVLPHPLRGPPIPDYY